MLIYIKVNLFSKNNILNQFPKNKKHKKVFFTAYV